MNISKLKVNESKISGFFNHKTVISSATLALALSTAPNTASAVGFIDNFNTCNGTGAGTSISGSPTPSGDACNFFSPGAFASTNAAGTNTANAGDILSPADRNFTYTGTSTSSNPSGSVNYFFNNVAASGVLGFFMNTGIGSLTLRYDNISFIPSTLGGGANTRFDLRVVDSDAQPARPINFALSFIQGGNTFTANATPITASGPQQVLFNFSAFTPGGFVPGNAVTQVDLTITGSDASDVQIDAFTVEPVPFDYSHELGLVAVGGLFGAAWLKRKNKKSVDNINATVVKVDQEV